MSTLEKLQNAEEDLWVSALQSDSYTQVEQRVLSQLLAAILYEEIAVPRPELPSSGPFEGELALVGKTKDGEPVEYIFYGKRKLSFRRFRVSRGTIKRKEQGAEPAAASLALFVEEVLGQVQQKEQVMQLLEELEQTLVKDMQAQHLKPSLALSDEQRQYDELEGNIIDAHPYHPCYKSRIGFSLQENALYGPEFKKKLQPVWIAVARSESRLALMDSVDYAAFMKEELGSSLYEEYSSYLREKELNPEHYWFMPVHPWQWERIIMTGFQRQIADRQIVPLGHGADEYRPQQSIRSWANVTHKEKPYVKLALSITNTSTKRVLASHTIMNAPLVSKWLLSLTQGDPTAKRLDFVFLTEFAGISFDYEKLTAVARLKAHGSLGVIWRQSIHHHLREDEQAVPLNALSYIDGEKPFIEPWVRQYGLEEWTGQLLSVSIHPIIHMLYAHGIAMESHAQNIILLHKEGWPVRVALKDLHDGLRFSREALPQPDAYPELHLEPAHHRAMNRHSYMQTEDLAAVTDFMHSAFFFVCLGELCMFLDEQYGLEESRFWAMAAQVVRQYQQEHPQYQQSYELYDLFAETIRIEQQARRRLWKDAEVEPRSVPNPLYAYR